MSAVNTKNEEDYEGNKYIKREGGVKVRDLGGDQFRRNKAAYSLAKWKAVKCYTIYRRNDFHFSWIRSQFSH